MTTCPMSGGECLGLSAFQGFFYSLAWPQDHGGVDSRLQVSAKVSSTLPKVTSLWTRLVSKGAQGGTRV